MGFNLTVCPPGWNDFTAAQGKFLVGTGSDGQGDVYALGANGGEARHQLTQAEMPSHSHPMTFGWGGPGGHIDTAGSGPGYDGYFGPGGSYPGHHATDAMGGTQPHENRPPYVAVRWCVKS